MVFSKQTNKKNAFSLMISDFWTTVY